MPKRNDSAPISLVWPGKVWPSRGATSKESKLPPAVFRSLRGDLYHGENLTISSALISKYGGKAALIYVDPPYGVGTFFHERDSKGTTLGRAYHDRKGNNEVQAFYDLLHSCRELLSASGTIWVQCDWRRSAIYRLLLDEVFGADNFVNHIIWGYKTGGVSRAKAFARKHDDILVYSKESKPYLKPHRQKSFVPSLPEPHTPSGKRLGVKRDPACGLCGHGAPGQKFRWVIGRDVWDDIPALFRNDREIVGYDTQKPEKLLERVITCGSQKNGLVMDFFSGSGTTAVVAERLGRRWIAVDRSPVAIRTAVKRLKENGLEDAERA